MEGYIANLGMPSHTHSINISYLRIGPGLGAGGGACMIFVFNCMNPQNLHMKNDSSWSINVSLGGKWSDVVKLLGKSKIFTVAPRVVKGISTASKNDLDNIRNTASYLSTVYEITDQTRDKVIVIDVPLAGAGLELSAHKLHGTIFIGELNTQPQKLDKNGIPSGRKRIGEL